MTEYVRRVSFLDPYPINIDPSEPLHFPPQFKSCDDYYPRKKDTQLPLDAGYGGGAINNIAQHYTQPVRRKSVTVRSMPDAPSKSILKKTDLPVLHKKSIVEMTDEELLAMDAQFAKASVQVQDFNFENQPTHFFTSERRGSTSTLKNKFDAVLRGYPSRPAVIHGSCCLTLKHRSWTEETRALLVIISGRKHTWKAIEYTLSNLVRDGDRIVIGAYAPAREIADNNAIEDEDEEEYEHARRYDISYSEIERTASNIMNFCLDYISRNDITDRLALTVDLINCESSKEVFKDCLKLYVPQLVVCGIKNNKPEIGDSLLWYKKKVSHVPFPYFLIDKCPTPVILCDGLEHSSMFKYTEKIPYDEESLNSGIFPADDLSSIDSAPELVTTSRTVSGCSVHSPYAQRLILKSDELTHEPPEVLRRKTSALVHSSSLVQPPDGPKVSFNTNIHKVRSLLPTIPDVSMSQSAAMAMPQYSKQQINGLMKERELRKSKSADFSRTKSAESKDSKDSRESKGIFKKLFRKK